jgi:hypothetical protein
VRGSSDEQALALIEGIERQKRTLDPDAMCEPESYWPVIVEHMRDGML